MKTANFVRSRKAWVRINIGIMFPEFPGLFEDENKRGVGEEDRSDGAEH